MRLFSALLLSIFSLLLFACNKTNKAVSDKVFDVPYYKEHKQERETMLEACRKDPGTLGDTPNCINAQTAELQIEASRKGGVTLERSFK